MTKRTLAAIVFALALLATACGSDGAETSTETAVDAGADAVESTPEVAEPTAAAADPTAEPASDASAVEGSDSPIENLLGIPIFDDSAMEEWFQNLSREAEIVVARCMLGEGFEYSPEIIDVTGVGEAGDRDSLDYAQTRGFGIVADFNEAAYDPATATADKNTIYLATLSDGERDAYFVALSGTVESEQTGDPFGQGGCRGQATDEVFSVVAILDEIEPVFDGYYDLYISDSRIIATTAEWQACMSEEGLLFGDEEEMFSHVFGMFQGILSNPEAFNELDEESASALGNEVHPGLQPAAQAEMDTLAEEEIRIAVANWTCREPIKETELAVQREYEAQFVTEVGPQVQTLRGDG